MPSPQYPFILRHAGSISLFLVALVTIAIAWLMPEEWRPFASPSEAHAFGVIGVFVLGFAAYVWHYWESGRYFKSNSLKDDNPDEK